MKKIILILIVTFCYLQSTTAQSRYIVRFKDKGTSPFSFANPSAYLSNRAIQRRVRYGIAIDSMDLPVTPRYVDSVRLAGVVTILNTSKWLNQVTIRTIDPIAISKINSLPFVQVMSVAANRMAETNVPVNKVLDGVDDVPLAPNPTTAKTTLDVFNYGSANNQVKIHQGEFLHNHGFRGEGMQVSVLDAGFYHYLTLPTFDSVRINNQIINIYDFVANETSVDEDHTHGMNCLSSIAANLPGVFVGTAPKANFCLYRTEDVASETRIEEHNLAAGYERADSMGVDVCSVSLGYNTFDIASQDYTYANMNGNTTMSAIATDIAAKKGMLPVVAAGNEGAKVWHYLITPGDADSALTVGAVNNAGVVASFSSYGPASNGKIKPNLAAVGQGAIVASPSTGLPVSGNGTSFATPNLAGLTTCLWQAFPEYNNMTIIDAMQKSATKATAPDDRVGYGIPDMKKAFVTLQTKSYTQNIVTTGCTLNATMNIKYDNSMTVVIEKKLSNQAVFTAYKTIAGAGTFTNKNVSFNDVFDTQSGGVVSYRVRVDIGTDTSFFISTINLTAPAICVNPIDEIKINPNPIVDVANVIISRAAPAKMSIVVTNSAGQRVYETTYQQASGAIVKTIDMQKLARGIYFITVLANDKKVETRRVFKK
jgi:serine protease AprX